MMENEYIVNKYEMQGVNCPNAALLFSSLLVPYRRYVSLR